MKSNNSIPIPSHYNDLNGSLGEAWRLLTRGAADRKSPMHTPAVATVGLDGRPRVRTVVLRHTDPAARTLRFHTDRRAAKISEFAANPAVQVLAYDAVGKVQLRLLGRAVAHQHDDIADAAWTRSQLQSQQCYRQSASPGMSAAEPSAALAPSDDDGRANFVAVVVHVDELEWLYLAHSGHRRARFIWSGSTLTATWLAP
ncbi:MAG: pyridoxamine 5'-phosphate oxidase family protein [Hyphomicrobium sp.]|nr:pyridoxamine 5'-phosphate oxidase family protein [Hyphomicrobium sp.]